MVAARGDLVKLSIFVGMLCYRARLLVGPENVFFVPVNQWKGQLSKELVELRIKKFYASRNFHAKFTSHEWDAVGIGLHVLGYTI